MAFVVLLALILSAVLYLYIGYLLSNQTKTLGDLFPIIFGRNAKVKTVDEFSTSSVATTVSLATIVLAYFELAGSYGIWLLWTALTGALGMLLVRITAKRIWIKMSHYEHRPSMHEFIGVEFNSKSVSLIASLCTSIGFLLIFATELVVGSKFLASLIPVIPQWITVVFLSLVGFIYTLYGGFRAVIKTDQIQMKFIWALIVSLGCYYICYVIYNGGLMVNLNKIPTGILNFSNKPGLSFFLLGIAIMNIPTHLSNMAVWQRISGVSDSVIFEKGISKSVLGIALSWSLLSLIACFSYMIVSPINNQSLLSDLLISISGSVFGKIVLFISIIGLYGAMLSTASTNLIVVGHTISEDLIAKIGGRSLEDRLDSKKEFSISRIILIATTLVAIFLVEGLKYFGFSIADLIFSIYGGALALFPLVLTSLYCSRNRLSFLSMYANVAVITGFILGWGFAIYGKLIENGNLIFLSPGISILSSSIIITLGLTLTHKKYKKHIQESILGYT